MSVSIADIVAGAIGYSVANRAPSLTADTTEMIRRVAAFEKDVFTAVAKENRFFFGTFTATPVVLTSGQHMVDTAVAGNVERLIRVYLGPFRLNESFDLHPVDLEDPDAELAPRYYMTGTQIVEVLDPATGANDWPSVASGVTYEYALTSALLDPLGSALQTITLPDKYADLLQIKLAAYLAGKDLESRDPAEMQNLESLYQSRLKSVITSLDIYQGDVRRRFINPMGYPNTSA